MKPGLYVATVRGTTGLHVWNDGSGDGALEFLIIEGPYVGQWEGNDGVTDARPLVVLDPESDEDTDRMADALAAEKRTPGWHETSRRVLRALAAPKPAEPMGLGAVVRDRAGWLWVKWSTAHRDDRNWKHESHSGEYRRWSDIDSPEVLSEGWSE